MDLRVGVNYRFEFEAPLSSLGYTVDQPDSGFYELTKIISNAQMRADNEDDIKATWDLPSNSSAADYETARDTYANDRMFFLRNLVTDEVIVVPSSLIITFPREDVAQYGKVIISADLGVVKNPDLVSGATDIIKDHILSDYGVDSSPFLSIYKKVWMVDSDVDAIEQDRLNNKARDYNLFADVTRLTAEKIELVARVAALEEIITNMGGV